MKMGGRILGYGYYRGERPTLRFPFNEFWDRELTYYSSLSQVGDFGRRWTPSPRARDQRQGR